MIVQTARLENAETLRVNFSLETLKLIHPNTSLEKSRMLGSFSAKPKRGEYSVNKAGYRPVCCPDPMIADSTEVRTGEWHRANEASKMQTAISASLIAASFTSIFH